MAKQQSKVTQVIRQGTLLGMDGKAVIEGLWEDCVYLGPDNFIYHITADEKNGNVITSITGKRAIGEYLRWVDGLFRPGEIPDESNGIHYRSARMLRELL